ncbi:MAG: diguanylate cyclase [Hydrogenophilales bacterium]|nr:diguanylate cyclase [Hydrogenophilales bacterium]
MNRLMLSHPPRLGFTLLLFLGLALLGMQWARQWPSASQPDTEAAAAQANLLRLTRELATHQQQTLAQINERLRVLGGLSLATASDTHSCGRLLARQLESLPGVDNLVVLDSQGKVRCTALPLSEILPQDFFRTSSANAEHRSLLPIMDSNNILFAFPLLSPAGRVEGRVLAIAPLAGWLRTSLLPIPAAVSLTLLDHAGQALVTEERAPAMIRGAPARLEAGVTTGIDHAGVEYWQAAAPLSGAASGLTLVARQAAPNAILETASALLGLLGLTLFMLASLATLRLAGSRLNPWWQGVKKIYSPMPARFMQRLRSKIAQAHGENTVMLLRRTNADLKRSLAAQESRNTQLQRLDQLNQMLLSSASLREAASAVAQCAHELLPHSGGALLLRTRPGVVETAVTWGHAAQHEFSRPEDCWALRLGHTYLVSQPLRAVCCTHLKTSAPGPYVCVPLIAQSALLGTLHLQAQTASAEAPCSWLAEALAQRAAGAISRIQREALLRAQATRDPLTGLHNRRFLEETLALEEMRAKRRGAPIGLMVLDVDHFKRFNDSFGHDAGDALLRALGRAIRSQVRKGDIPCRFGGEEFVIVLPGADLDITVARAEALRLAVRELNVRHGEQALGPITVSIGVACYPRHGANCQAVLKVADQALYAGKHAGRDRVMRPAPMLVTSN